MKLPILYSRTNTGAIQTWTIEIHENKYRTHYGQLDGAIQTTEWTVCKGKNVGKANGTTDNEQAYKDAQALWKKKKASGCFDHIKDIDNFTFTEPMLAKQYEDYADDLRYPLYSQPKLDGIRCLVKKDGMWSRNGKPIISAPHILDELKDYFDKHPNTILDGELYCDRLSHDFNKICSLVKKTVPTVKDFQESAETIQYWIYDIVDSKLNFEDRYTQFESITPTKSIRKVPTTLAYTTNQLNSLYEEYVEKGYEGQMARLNRPYENKRSKYLLKRKEFKDSEFTILGIFEGEGNKTGMAGYMTFKNHKGIEFRSNIKGDREYLKELWKNKDKYIGRSATVKYFNLTPGDEVPRFPYVINIDRESYE